MAIPFLNNINLSDNQILNAKLHVTSSAPTAAKGQVYLNSTTGVNKLSYHNGAGWVIADATSSAVFNASTNVITFTRSSGDTYTVDLSDLETSFTIAGDTGTQIIANNDTLTASGGTYITTAVTATDALTISHDLTSRTDTTSASSPAYGATFDTVTSVTTNATGHVTAINVDTVTLPAYSWTISDGTTSQAITNGNTLTVSATDEIEAVVSATDTLTIGHADVTRTNTTSTDSPAYQSTFTAIDSVTSNARGHITGVNTKTVTLPAAQIPVADDTTAAAQPIVFVADAGTNVDLRVDGTGADDFTYNPSTQTLYVKNLTVDGNQTIKNETVSIVVDNTIRFEGATADGFETDLTVVDPTADRTINLPDASGTVALTSDINDATLTVQGSSGLTGSGTFTANDADNTTITISHANTSSQASVDNSGLNVIQDVTLDTYGHVTALGSADLTSGINSLISTALAATGYATTITDTATVTHGLNTYDVVIQLVDDTTKETVYADVDRISTTEATITFASTPTSNVRVLVQKIL